MAYWRRRRDHERKLCRAAAAQATADAHRIAALLQERYGVSRVLLFGSLARGRFTQESDIDLAVAGLPEAAFFTAMADANTCTRHWVDLKPLEAVWPHFRKRILEDELR